MTRLSDQIIGKIKCENITPVPRWHFLFKGFGFWFLFATSMILGSASFSVIVHVIKSGDFDIIDHLQGNLITSTVMLFPYLWLALLIIFSMTAYLNWKCTKHGYRYKRRWIVFGSVIFSVFVGSIFYFLGMGKTVDYLMAKALPIYSKSKRAARKELWQQPEKGLLTGKIIGIDEVEEKLKVKDENNKIWIVRDKDITWENTNLEEEGKIVKIIGQRTGESDFKAQEVRVCDNCLDDEEVDSVRVSSSCVKPEIVCTK